MKYMLRTADSRWPWHSQIHCIYNPWSSWEWTDSKPVDFVVAIAAAAWSVERKLEPSCASCATCIVARNLHHVLGHEISARGFATSWQVRRGPIWPWRFRPTRLACRLGVNGEVAGVANNGFCYNNCTWGIVGSGVTRASEENRVTDFSMGRKFPHYCRNWGSNTPCFNNDLAVCKKNVRDFCRIRPYFIQHNRWLKKNRSNKTWNGDVTHE